MDLVIDVVTVPLEELQLRAFEPPPDEELALRLSDQLPQLVRWNVEP